MATITKQGLEKLTKELEELKGPRRRELSERLRKAIAMGDLSENFDYKDAKEQQEFLERKIAEIEDTLATCKVAESKQGTDTVQMGSRVTIREGAEEFSYTMCGPQEADPSRGKLSAQSPLGQALLGRRKGDKVRVDTPTGTVLYTVSAIA